LWPRRKTVRGKRYVKPVQVRDYYFRAEVVKIDGNGTRLCTYVAGDEAEQEESYLRE
jgi:hypothetical protein